ncbi:hypothetical protein KBZ21_40850, partial [Streptomyces sp. A73]|nr:hypothetical protein [Streptomyces sp. A73]
PTGFADLDTLTSGGLRPGRMVVVGARPGVGKTLFGTGLARAATRAHSRLHGPRNDHTQGDRRMNRITAASLLAAYIATIPA